MRTVDDVYRRIRQRFPNLYPIGVQSRPSVTPVLAGGAVRDCFMGIDPDDWDFFVKSEAEGRRLLSTFAIEEMMYDGDAPALAHYSDNKIKYLWKFKGDGGIGTMYIDIVVVHYRTIRQVINRFDYTINSAAMRVGTNEFTCHPYFFPDLHHGILRQVDDYRDISDRREREMEEKGFRRLEQECTRSQTTEASPAPSTNSSPRSVGNPDFTCSQADPPSSGQRESSTPAPESFVQWVPPPYAQPPSGETEPLRPGTILNTWSTNAAPRYSTSQRWAGGLGDSWTTATGAAISNSDTSGS